MYHVHPSAFLSHASLLHRLLWKKHKLDEELNRYNLKEGLPTGSPSFLYVLKWFLWLIW